jgi:hypothetical protein
VSNFNDKINNEIIKSCFENQCFEKCSDLKNKVQAVTAIMGFTVSTASVNFYIYFDRVEMKHPEVRSHGEYDVAKGDSNSGPSSVAFLYL